MKNSSMASFWPILRLLEALLQAYIGMLLRNILNPFTSGGSLAWISLLLGFLDLSDVAFVCLLQWSRSNCSLLCLFSNVEFF